MVSRPPAAVGAPTPARGTGLAIPGARHDRRDGSTHPRTPVSEQMGSGAPSPPAALRPIGAPMPSVQLAPLDGVNLAYRAVGSGEPVLLIHAGVLADWFAPLLGEPTLTD